MPMLVNFLVVFGVIEVVYRPLQRISAFGVLAANAPPRPASFALGISAAGGPLPSAPPVPCQAFPPK